MVSENSYGITEVRYFGIITAAERSLAMDDAAAALASAAHCRLLVDLTKATMIERRQPPLGEYVANTIATLIACKVAVVDPAALANAGPEEVIRHIRVRTFVERNTAIRWLLTH